MVSSLSGLSKRSRAERRRDGQAQRIIELDRARRCVTVRARLVAGYRGRRRFFGLFVDFASTAAAQIQRRRDAVRVVVLAAQIQGGTACVVVSADEQAEGAVAHQRRFGEQRRSL